MKRIAFLILFTFACGSRTESPTIASRARPVKPDKPCRGSKCKEPAVDAAVPDAAPDVAPDLPVPDAPPPDTVVIPPDLGSPDVATTVDAGTPPEICSFDVASSPESVGMSSVLLQHAVDTARGWATDETIIGGVLVVLRYNQLVVADAFGWSDRERAIPMPLDAVFDIRSNSKPMHGSAALTLYEDALLDDLTRVSDHIPSWDNVLSRDITTFQLFTHTSGLPCCLNSYDSLAGMVDQIGLEGPDDPPGTTYLYSDRGSNSLGRLAEVIAATPSEEFIDATIVQPLGLVDTFGVLTMDDPRRGRAVSKYEGGPQNWTKSWDNTQSVTQIFAPAYGMHSTAPEYACFMQTMLSGGERRGVRLLEAATVEMATSPQNHYVFTPDQLATMWTYYGYHWFVTVKGDPPDLNRHHMFGHGGSWETTAWSDKLHNMVFVYFTQSRDSGTLLTLRGLVHDAIMD